MIESLITCEECKAEMFGVQVSNPGPMSSHMPPSKLGKENHADRVKEKPHCLANSMHGRSAEINGAGALLELNVN